MWEHPFTEKHLDILQNIFKVKVVPPISKLLACGDLGNSNLILFITVF